jgi:hypothetical protein
MIGVGCGSGESRFLQGSGRGLARPAGRGAQMTAQQASETLVALAPFIAAGFLAQLIDGALGMAFGVITNTFLVSVIGLAPARASASVHLVEVFTTAASAISHVVHRNVDWRLFRRLAIPGVAGGVAGAYLLTNMQAEAARPFVMAYLTLIGIYLVWRGIRLQEPAGTRPLILVSPLAVVGGFLDAVGGGGWGPVVTSNLLIQGGDPRRTIGTVNTVEFFLTTVVSLTFLATLGPGAFTVAVSGLIIGGLLAAPLGAFFAKRVPGRLLLVCVGLVVCATSIFSLLNR